MNSLIDQILTNVVDSSNLESVSFVVADKNDDNSDTSNDGLNKGEAAIPKFANIYQKEAFLIF